MPQPCQRKACWGTTEGGVQCALLFSRITEVQGIDVLMCHDNTRPLCPWSSVTELHNFWIIHNPPNRSQSWDYSVRTLKLLLSQHSFVLKQHLLLPMTLHRTVISTDIVINCFGKHITNCTQEIKTELQLGTVLNQKLSSSYLPLLTKQYLLSWVNEMIKD